MSPEKKELLVGSRSSSESKSSSSADAGSSKLLQFGDKWLMDVKMMPYVSPASVQTQISKACLSEKSHSSPIKRDGSTARAREGNCICCHSLQKKSAYSQIKPCVENPKLLSLVNFTLAQDLTHPGYSTQDSLRLISKILKHSHVAVCEWNHY